MFGRVSQKLVGLSPVRDLWQSSRDHLCPSPVLVVTKNTITIATICNSVMRLYGGLQALSSQQICSARLKDSEANAVWSRRSPPNTKTLQESTDEW